MKPMSRYKDGEWVVYPGKVTLKIISGGAMTEPKDYHDHIRWRRIALFLIIAVPTMTVLKLVLP